ncbi:MAG TPA: polysaccharide biosynthesis C-terminal domain-containing protein [Gemmatimonadales bacterium]|nr:polysaccharide biosynthesis C-terminal domain-containing protein [Gemmatimonadales bacterium]
MLRNVSSNWIVTLLSILSAYLLTPFTLHQLGNDGYGTWNLIASITGYIGLLALGVPMASVRYFAQYAAEGDIPKLNAAVGSCTALYLALGAVALVVGGVLYAVFRFNYNLPMAIRGDANVAFVLTVLFLAVGFVGMLPSAILSAHDDFVLRNTVRMAGIVLRVGLTLWLLSVHATLAVVALIQLACLLFDFCACCLIVVRRYPGIRIRLGDFEWVMVRRIFSFSFYVLLLNVGLRLAFETDALVIGAFRDVGSIPFFTIASSLILYLMEMILAIAAVVMPTATRLNTQGKSAELRAIFLKWSKIAFSLTMMPGLFLLVLGPRFMAWWINSTFERPSGQVLQILLWSSLVFLPARGVALPILMGLGKPGLPTIGFLAASLLNLALSVWLVHPLGLVGVALGTAIPNAIFAGLVVVHACRELKTPIADYLRYVIPRVTLGAVPALALLLWFKLGLEVRSLGGLAGAGVAMTLLFGFTSLVFVYRNDPYMDLWLRLARFRGRNGA